jgi:uncharacterized protein (DUF2267 family)
MSKTCAQLSTVVSTVIQQSCHGRDRRAALFGPAIAWYLVNIHTTFTRQATMTETITYQNVHGVEEFHVTIETDEATQHSRNDNPRRNIPALASTVQKTKHWIKDVMIELQWDSAQKAYHAMRAVLHALRDRLTLHETAEFAAQLPMLVRGMFYEGWRPDRGPVKDRTKEAFLAHIFKAFPDDQGVDPERVTHAVLTVVARHVSEGEMEDITATLPKPLRELFPKKTT